MLLFKSYHFMSGANQPSKYYEKPRIVSHVGEHLNNYNNHRIMQHNYFRFQKMIMLVQNGHFRTA